MPSHPLCARPTLHALLPLLLSGFASGQLQCLFRVRASSDPGDRTSRPFVAGVLPVKGCPRGAACKSIDGCLRVCLQSPTLPCSARTLAFLGGSTGLLQPSDPTKTRPKTRLTNHPQADMRGLWSSARARPRSRRERHPQPTPSTLGLERAWARQIGEPKYSETELDPPFLSREVCAHPHSGLRRGFLSELPST